MPILRGPDFIGTTKNLQTPRRTRRKVLGGVQPERIQILRYAQNDGRLRVLSDNPNASLRVPTCRDEVISRIARRLPLFVRNDIRRKVGGTNALIARPKPEICYDINAKVAFIR